MSLFNSNAFLLGTIVFSAISLVNFIGVWLCKIWKVKIIEFSIFLNPWFSLFKKESNGTIYKLGWLPLGSYIKPLGMLEEEDSKSKTKQVIFRLIPALVWLFVLLLSLYVFNGNMLKAIEDMFNYIVLATKTMFGLSSTGEFVKKTTDMLINTNIIAFALTLLISVYFVLTALTKITAIYSQDGKKSIGLIKLIGWIVVIGGAYLTFWKIPVFVFSFFSFQQNISYIISFLLGLFIVGSLFFILTMMLVKLQSARHE